VGIRTGLQVDTGSAVEQVGETAYVWPAPISIAGPVVFQDALLGTTVESVDSADGFQGRQ
jgi:hypothetical protein